MVTLKPQVKRPDTLLLAVVLGLTFFGILMVYDASSVIAFKDFGDKFFYARQQTIWVAVGLICLFFASRFNYHRFKPMAAPMMFLTIFFLVLVLFPGIGIKILGARRWLIFGEFTFQPAELAKLTVVIYLSSLFLQKPRLLPFIFTLTLLSFLIMKEPDLGTTVILASSGFLTYFASGASLFSVLGISAAGLLSGFILIFSSAYRKTRLLTFLDPSKDPLGTSYHIRQVLIALGSGGLFGVGLGASRQKYSYLPEAMTDSIFAVIAEELGFVGCLLLIGVFLFIIWRGIKVAREAPDRFGQLLGAGIACWIGIQTVVNLSAMVVLIPLTGVPLPFVSYGGSSLVVALTGVGILLNISKQRVARK